MAMSSQEKQLFKDLLRYITIDHGVITSISPKLVAPDITTIEQANQSKVELKQKKQVELDRLI